MALRMFARTVIDDVRKDWDVRTDADVCGFFEKTRTKRTGQVSSAIRRMLLRAESFDALYHEVAADPDALVIFDREILRLSDFTR